MDALLTNRPLLVRVRNDNDEDDDLRLTALCSPHNDDSSEDTVQLQLLLQHLTLQLLRIGTEQLHLTHAPQTHVSSVGQRVRLVHDDVQLLATVDYLICPSPTFPSQTDVVDHDALHSVQLLLHTGGRVRIRIVPLRLFITPPSNEHHQLANRGGELRHGKGLSRLGAIATHHHSKPPPPVGGREVVRHLRQEVLPLSHTMNSYEHDTQRHITIRHSHVRDSTLVQHGEIVLARRDWLRQKATCRSGSCVSPEEGTWGADSG